MRIVVSDFISLDGVVQAPGGPDEDTDGGFRHGGWSMPYFDVDTMGPAVGEIMAATEALLFGRRTWQAHGGGAPPARAGGRPVRRPDERDPEVCGVTDAGAAGPRLAGLDAVAGRTTRSEPCGSCGPVTARRCR